MSQSEVAKRLSAVKAVVFDLDDTLYSEQAYVYSGFRAVSRQIAQLEPSLQALHVYEMLVKTFEVKPPVQVFNRVLDQLGQRSDDQIIAELVSLYRCHRPVLEINPAVRKMLESLRSRYSLGLITDGRLPAQRLKVEALGIEGHFDHIVYTEELGREHWKPSVKSFELMAKTLGVPHENCVYIGDNPSKDFVAPNRLGWQTVQVKSQGQVYEDVETAEGGAAKMVVGDVVDVLSQLV